MKFKGTLVLNYAKTSELNYKYFNITINNHVYRLSDLSNRLRITTYLK